MIHHTFLLPVSADEALVAHRDGLPDFGTALPGISTVTPTTLVTRGSTQLLEHHWQGDTGILPALVRARITPEQVSWRDRSVWDSHQREGSWEIHIPVLGAGPQMQGTHRFRDVPGGCEVRISAQMSFVADANTRLLGIRVGRWLAPVLQRAVGDVFRAIVTRSGDVITAWVAEHRLAQAA